MLRMSKYREVQIFPTAGLSQTFCEDGDLSERRDKEAPWPGLISSDTVLE